MRRPAIKQRETPLLQIELNAEGSDYAVLADAPGGDFPRHWPVLFGVLEDAQDKLTRTQPFAPFGAFGA